VSKGDIPSYAANGESCVTTLEYLGALDDAADLEKNLGDRCLPPVQGARRARPHWTLRQMLERVARAFGRHTGSEGILATGQRAGCSL